MSLTALLSLLLCCLLCAVVASAQSPAPPRTRRAEVRETLHGIEITDPYRWLEDQESPETRAWIAEQNDHTRALLAGLPVRAKLSARLERLLRVERSGLPVVRAGRYFYWRKRPQDEQAILYWRQGLRGKDRVLLDPNEMSGDHTTSALYLDVSRDGSRAAVGVRQGGEDELEVRIVDVATGAEVGDRIPRAHVEDFSFTTDGSSCYYTLLEPLVGRRVYRRGIREATDGNRLVFGEGYGPEIMVGQFVSENGRWLALQVYRGWTQNDLYVQDLQAGGPIRPVVVGVDATFSPLFAGDRLFVLTDYEAPGRRVLEADPTGTRPLGQWREVVPTGADAIEGCSAAAGTLFVSSLRDVSTRIAMYDLDGARLGDLRLPGIGSASTPSGPWQGREAFYSFESFTTPSQVRRIELPSLRQTAWSRVRVPFRSGEYLTRQVRYRSNDGVEIPMFLVHRKGIKLDGKRPTHLTGYGGFAVSMTPGFDPEAALWIEDGGVYAVPALRGGGEFGEDWHRAGMLDRKQNVFDDFHCAAEWLIANRVTSPARLAVSGGSNGGLLVGAALTQRPELFRAVLCEVPLLDMLRYHLFLQGPQWVPEYGSAENPTQFATLRAYSPYHHVRPGTRYPAVLFVTGDADTRVAPLHARKMTALLQSLPGQDRPILLYYETTVGHSGGEPVRRQVERRSLVIAFLYHELKMDGP